ncbi:LAQU0S17e00980g1_1 [Lachancea quebecensis]|uniref:LAQU0S17e00980g1_1 n=1 Tax=Lachancea quebecensis TaxID=1654605 RepID=A0A0P1KYM1_9SACH|nr:LAQU0S17e00980g1_1 [Lachancea quebecensis]
MSVRPASHAGSWYNANSGKLALQLQQYLGQGQPVAGARVIISPHAGYAYCGATMGKVYAALDLTNVKRIFVLGPSHHIYFKNRAHVSSFREVATPLGPIPVDIATVEELVEDEAFEYMDAEVDVEEHSLEMQFPMLHALLNLRGIDTASVGVVPIMISHNSTRSDQHLGKVLSEYLADQSTVFIISSDFCHWGRRFSFTGYVGDKSEIQEALAEDTEIESLTARSKLSHHQVPIWKSIEILDQYAMSVLSQTDPHDKYDLWKHYLEVTGNTICGEKAISVMLCALSHRAGSAVFQWPAYAQSSRVTSVMDSSVSYGGGYCKI